MAIEIRQGLWNGQSRRFVAGRAMAFVDLAALGIGPVGLTPDFAKSIVGDALDDLGLQDAHVVHAKPRFHGVELKMPPTNDPSDPYFPTTFSLNLSGDPRIKFVEPVFFAFAAQGGVNSEYYSSEQVGLQQIAAAGAWLQGERGSSGVVIGIADSGLPVAADNTLLHHDLRDLDNRPIVIGADYTAEWDDTGTVTPMNDTHGHGTHVLGIAAADTGNDEGIAGVNWYSPVYVVRVLDHSKQLVTPPAGVDVPEPITEELVGTGSAVVWAVVDIVNYVRANGKRGVINLSLWTEQDAAAILEAFQYAHADPTDAALRDDILICVAAGNTLGGAASFPGSLAATLPYVVAVGSAAKDMSTMSEQSAHDAAITVVAPGEEIFSTEPGDTYGRRDGTSMATAFVTGVASLMWSRNTALTPAQIKCCLRSSSTRLIPRLAGFSTEPERYRFVDASSAVASVAWIVEVESLHLTFIDVDPLLPHDRHVWLNVRSCAPLEFRIVDGPTTDAGSSAGSSFSAPDGAVYHHQPTMGNLSGSVSIRVRYSGSGAGDVAWGTMTLECVETGQQWTVYLTASTRTAVTNAVVMALDVSGSMNLPSGFAGLTRHELLQESLSSLLAYAPAPNRMGLVRFDHIAGVAHDVALIRADRQSLIDTVNALAPTNGWTSIGNAVALADGQLENLAGASVKATIVLSDGEENRPKTIDQVMPAIQNPVYAIAMGAPGTVSTAELTALTAATGGYVLLTGDLEGEDRFKLLKYYLQIYTNVTGGSIVVDPQSIVHPRRPVHVPFCITEGDRSADVILMTTTGDAIGCQLLGPSGQEVDASTTGITVAEGPAARVYHCDLERLAKDQVVLGTWYAVVSVGERAFERFRRSPAAGGNPFARLGIPFDVVVQARSPLRLHCRLRQTGFEPGAMLTLQATVTAADLPVSGIDTAEVVVSKPDGARYAAPMKSVAPGYFEVTIPTDSAGIYTCRTRVRGTAADRRPFMREQTLTGAVWRAGNRSLAVPAIPANRIPRPFP